MSTPLSRRQFLKMATAAGICIPALSCGRSSDAATPIPRQVLGKTGEKVSVFGIGGASNKNPLSNGQRDLGLKVVNRALQLGVNYIDTATSYGSSEEYLGEIVPASRDKIFLATKTDGRTRDAAWRELEISLKRLKTDYLDLWQMHHVSLHERDTVPAFADNGCIKAIEEAKEQKLIRFAGVTGHHDPAVLADWLRRYPFDALLAAVNCADVHHKDSFIRNLLPVAREREVPVIAMKIPAYGRLINKARGVSMREAMHYALSQPGVVTCVISSDNVKMLEENVAAAREWKAPLSKERQKEIEDLTAAYWEQDKAGFYRSWT